jgi:hypothetical protein
MGFTPEGVAKKLSTLICLGSSAWIPSAWEEHNRKRLLEEGCSTEERLLTEQGIL